MLKIFHLKIFLGSPKIEQFFCCLKRLKLHETRIKLVLRKMFVHFWFLELVYWLHYTYKWTIFFQTIFLPNIIELCCICGYIITQNTIVQRTCIKIGGGCWNIYILIRLGFFRSFQISCDNRHQLAVMSEVRLSMSSVLVRTVRRWVVRGADEKCINTIIL